MCCLKIGDGSCLNFWFSSSKDNIGAKVPGETWNAAKSR